MRESLNKPAFQRLWKVALFTLIWIVGLAVTFDFYYDLNDDTTIKDIISGAYTGNPSGYSIQMLYPLSFLVSLFYKAIPEVSWYGLFLCVCQFGALSLIAWRVTGFVKSQWKQLALLLFETAFAAGMLFRQFVMLQYSVTSGICMAAAIFLFISGEEKDTTGQYLKQNMVPILLVILSFMIRTEMCMMLFPFLLLAGFAKWMANNKPFTARNIKKYFYVLGTALLGMLIVFSLDKLAYATASDSDEWKGFWRFFDARTNLYDFYGLPSYEENQDFYQEIGLSRESYTLLENYNFSLDESIDEHLLEKIVDYQQEHAGQENSPLSKTAGFVSKNNLKEALWLYKEHLLGNKDGFYAYLLLALYLSYILLAGNRKKSGCYWKIFLLVVIRSVLWIYLWMVDRSLERITCPLLLAESIVLLGWIAEEAGSKRGNQKEIFTRKSQVAVIALLLALCTAFAFVGNIERTTKEYADRERMNSRWESLMTYCKGHKEAYYVVDVYSSTSYEGIPYSEKVFTNVDNSYRNFDICGGWLSKSPLMRKKLAESEIHDLELALCEGTQVYFIAGCDKDLTWLVDYYAWKGQEVEPEKIDTIYDGENQCFAVYQLRKHT